MEREVVKKTHRFLLMLLFLSGTMSLIGSSCRQNLKSDLPVVVLKIGSQKIQVEVACKIVTRETGLMFRREMGRDNGMLFVFPNNERRAFWMKNTYIPLSIAFLDEKGTIVNILEMPPLTEESFFSKGPAKYALEMNRAWFAKHGLKAGDLVEGVFDAPMAQ